MYRYKLQLFIIKHTNGNTAVNPDGKKVGTKRVIKDI